MFYLILILCWLAYATLTIFSPVQPDPRFHLGGLTAVSLRLSFLIPVLFIWLVALRSILALYHYTKLIAISPEARGLKLIAAGLSWSLAYFISLSLISPLLPYLAHSPSIETLISLRNHLPVITSSIAFWLLYAGTHRLQPIAGFRTWTPRTIAIFTLYIIGAVVFVYAFRFSPVTLDSNGLPTYTLTQNTLLFTLVLPYLAAWFAGLLAGINIIKYARTVKGSIYRRVLQDVARGILCVVLFQILIQVISLTSRFLTQWNLTGLLLLTYSLLILYGLGFWFIHHGTNKLTQLEGPQ